MHRCLALFPILAGTWLSAGCAWVGLGWGALTYPTTQAGESANVVTTADFAYATRGAAGLDAIDLRGPGGRRVPVPVALESADDLAIADGLLFVLDANPPGHLAVFSLRDPAAPVLLGTPVAVDVGPFSGVSAAAGVAVVSGGTSQLSLWRYDADGNLTRAPATADLGRGQPDALVSPDGMRAFVSTHDWGPYFSLKILALAGDAPTTLGSLALDSYGFTPGGAKPANFPIESALDGDTLYVANAAGLSVIDVSDARAPRALATLDPGVRAVNVDVLDGVAAVVGSSPHPLLAFVDVRDRAHPKVLQSFPLPEDSRATGVALTATHAVVAAHAHGTLLFDRSKGAWEPITSLKESQP